MDSKENNQQQQPIKTNIDVRLRTDSESSTDARFLLPSLDGSPPKVVTMDEVTSMFKNLRNMELAHEIALNPEFKLQPYEPPMERWVTSLSLTLFLSIYLSAFFFLTLCLSCVKHMIIGRARKWSYY